MPFPRIQAPAPEFSCTALMPDKSFKDISLTDYKGKWVVLFFYPLDFTFVCPTEIIAFADRQEEFDQINTQVIAASCDNKFTHLAWCQTPRTEGGLGDMQIPILADFSKTVATDYGCLIPDGEDAGVPLRALYIISPTGQLRQITCNDLPVGRNVDEIIRLVKAFQFVDEHGEVCPANWQPGDLTIVDDPVKKLKYFAAANEATTTTGSTDGLVDINDEGVFNSTIAKGITVVDYWAPWCRNCKKVAPILSKLASEFPSASFVKVDTTIMDEMASKYEVDALPTLHFFKNGKKIGDYKGSDGAGIEKAVRGFM